MCVSDGHLHRLIQVRQLIDTRIRSTHSVWSNYRWKNHLKIMLMLKEILEKKCNFALEKERIKLPSKLLFRHKIKITFQVIFPLQTTHYAYAHCRCYLLFCFLYLRIIIRNLLFHLD